MYDTVQRLNDSRFGSEDRDVNEIHDYIAFGPLGEAFKIVSNLSKSIKKV